MSEIAQLFTEFFRDLDVVPSDIVAGLVLLRHHQKHRMKSIIAQVKIQSHCSGQNTVLLCKFHDPSTFSKLWHVLVGLSFVCFCF